MGHPPNPQTLNAYAYVQNNPITLLDADGHAVQNSPNGSQTNAGCGADGVCRLFVDDASSAETSYVQQVQEAQQRANNRTGYDTQDQAAAAALTNSNGASIRQNKEYAGLLYKDRGGRYHYTGPVAGTDQGANPHAAKAPRGTKVVGDYHTHGDYSVMGPNGNAHRTHDPHHDDFNSNHFSARDKSGIAHDGTGKPEYRGYLGTPSGRFLVYNPITGQEGVLQ